LLPSKRLVITPVFCYLTILLFTNITLLLPNGSILRIFGALLLLGGLPGLSWAIWLYPKQPRLQQLIIGATVSYTVTCLTGLLLHYLSGPIPLWPILTILNGVALLPLLLGYQQVSTQQFNNLTAWQLSKLIKRGWAFGIILLIALFLRLFNLGYSEFQGDEALAMLSAAEAIMGHEDALFLRSKGPAEVLLPLMMWQLTGTINEATARLPFTASAMFALVTIYLLGVKIAQARWPNHPTAAQHLGLLAMGLFSINGFMVAFGRIVQYQAVVVWMSSLAFLLVIYWRETLQQRFALMAGLAIGTGLLAHYDTILVIPAIGWLLIYPTTKETLPKSYSQPVITIPKENRAKDSKQSLDTKVHLAHFIRTFPTLLIFIGGILITALPFYLPYALDPQANRAGAYVGDRIGNELRNNLPDFFHFNSFYSSFYYIVLTTVLLFGWLIWLIYRHHDKHAQPNSLLPAHNLWRFIALIIGIGIIWVIGFPTALQSSWIDASFLPFALLFLMVFLILPFFSIEQALLVWLAVPFLGYNFVVALGLTHIYTIVPAWSLIVSLSLYPILSNTTSSTPSTLFTPRYALRFILYLLFFLSTIFLANAFLRTDIQYWQDYPAGNLSLFWSPYTEPPQAGFFGFVHRAGWKAVGQKITTEEFAGDYNSNEEPDVTTWYTRGAPRSCDEMAEFYFIADDIIDLVDLPNDILEQNYANIGEFIVPNGKTMPIKQRLPTGLTLGQIEDEALAYQFDTTAFPSAFARSIDDVLPLDINFSQQIKLTGYKLDNPRAYPGGRLPITLYWQALTSLSDSYHISAQLIHDESGMVAQADGIPVCWSYPTNLWRPGQIIADQQAINLPTDLPLGDYRIEVGIYQPETGIRLDWLDVAGNPGGVSVVITEVAITN